MEPGTRQKLIETAIDLIWQSSYGAVGVEAICREAGVGKGSFYHFFPSKAALAAAAMEEHFKRERPALDAAFASDIPPLERIENLADLIVEKQTRALKKYGRVCGCPFAVLGSEIAGREEGIRACAEDVFSVHRRHCEETLRDAAAGDLIAQDTDCGAVADEMCAYIMGRIMMARIGNSLETLRRDLCDGLFRVIGADFAQDGRQKTRQVKR